MSETKTEAISNTADLPAAEGERYTRPLGFITRIILMVACISWCLFQLSVASWLILDSTFVRAIHLGFAMLIVFLGYAAFGRKGEKQTSSVFSTVSAYALAIVGTVSALYLILDYEAIAERYGSPSQMDRVMGVILIILLLEGARRVIGPALSIIAFLFCLYAFFGPYMPDLIAFKGVSLDRFIGQMTMSTEGIYGIPLDVSATVVFLFVLLGAMMEKAGAGRYFIQLALSLLGGFRGGPAKAAVMGSGLTGMVSGSSIANIVTTGTFTIPMMKRVGYPPTKAASIEVAASTDGQLAPPIMGAAAFIIAEYINVSYSEVIKAAAIPAFASYAALFFITHLEASKLGLKGLAKDQIPAFVKTLLSGFHFMLPVFWLIYELVYLRHSAEKAAFNTVMIMGVVMLGQHFFKAYKQNSNYGTALWDGIKELGGAMENGARNMVAVALATAAAGIIVGVVAMGLGGLITEVIDTLSMGNIYLMAGITAVTCLLIGMGLPTTATYIVMAALTAPAMVQIAGYQDIFIPLIAAHLFCFYFGILADDTPPVGLAAYAAAAIAKSPPIPTGIQAFTYDVRTAILPFMFLFNHDLILHGINSWSMGIMIFGFTALGTCAFAAATQGWFVRKNTWIHTLLLIAASFCFLRPDYIASLMQLDEALRYWTCLIPLAIIGIIYVWQMKRDKLAMA